MSSIKDIISVKIVEGRIQNKYLLIMQYSIRIQDSGSLFVFQVFNSCDRTFLINKQIVRQATYSFNKYCGIKHKDIQHV